MKLQFSLGIPGNMVTVLVPMVYGLCGMVRMYFGCLRISGRPFPIFCRRVSVWDVYQVGSGVLSFHQPNVPFPNLHSVKLSLSFLSDFLQKGSKGIGTIYILFRFHSL
jgi:hypothetical protein